MCSAVFGGGLRIETESSNRKVVALVLVDSPGADGCGGINGSPDYEQLANQADDLLPWRLGKPLKEVHNAVHQLCNCCHRRMRAECRGEEFHCCNKVLLDRAVPRPAGDDRQILSTYVAVRLLNPAGDAESRLDACEEQRDTV